MSFPQGYIPTYPRLARGHIRWIQGQPFPTSNFRNAPDPPVGQDFQDIYAWEYLNAEWYFIPWRTIDRLKDEPVRYANDKDDENGKDNKAGFGDLLLGSTLEYADDVDQAVQSQVERIIPENPEPPSSDNGASGAANLEPASSDTNHATIAKLRVRQLRHIKKIYTGTGIVVDTASDYSVVGCYKVGPDLQFATYERNYTGMMMDERPHHIAMHELDGKPLKVYEIDRDQIEQRNPKEFGKKYAELYREMERRMVNVVKFEDNPPIFWQRQG